MRLRIKKGGVVGNFKVQSTIGRSYHKQGDFIEMIGVVVSLYNYLCMRKQHLCTDYCTNSDAVGEVSPGKCTERKVVPGGRELLSIGYSICYTRQESRRLHPTYRAPLTAENTPRTPFVIVLTKRTLMLSTGLVLYNTSIIHQYYHITLQPGNLHFPSLPPIVETHCKQQNHVINFWHYVICFLNCLWMMTKT